MVHLGKKVERIRELRGMKQDTLALKMGLSQQTVSRLEQSETIDDEKLQLVANALEISVDAIKNFDENAIFSNINSNHTFHDSSSLNNNYHCTFNPIDKIIELYEKVIRDKDEIIEMYKKQQKAS